MYKIYSNEHGRYLGVTLLLEDEFQSTKKKLKKKKRK